MKPTPCYRVTGCAITNSAQLEFLKRYFLYKRMVFQQKSPSSQRDINALIEKRKQVKQAIKEGLAHQPLVKQKELYTPCTRYPDVVIELEEGNYYFKGEERGFYKKVNEMPKSLPTFKLTSIEEIKISEKKDENEKLYYDKKMYITAKIFSEGKYYSCSSIVLVKEDKYICVERVFCAGDFGRINDYMNNNTISYQQTFFQQFFSRKIDLALLGHGDLMKYKVLPVITMPVQIKEK